MMLEYREDDTKAGRSEVVILPLETAEIITEYVDHHRKYLTPEGTPDKGHLFPAKSGQPLAKSSMWWITRHITKSTIGQRVHPHLWRSILDSHVANLAAIGIGKGLPLTQRMSWQVDAKTTAKYTDLEYTTTGIAALDLQFSSPYPAMD